MTTRVLEGKSALVTGGAGGFGLACARLLVRDGAAVTLMGRTAESLEAASAELLAQYADAEVRISIGDAMSEADVGAAMDLAASGPHRFCIVVATVGGSRSRGFVDTPADAFMDTVAYNVRSAYIAIREGIRRIEQGGAFAFISSTAAEIPFDGMPGYCAGKAALDHLVRAAARPDADGSDAGFVFQRGNDEALYRAHPAGPGWRTRGNCRGDAFPRRAGGFVDNRAELCG
jgi:NAD(P)-dependent dehydrogenase (short-subunit alcohol dehydrogenase family)